MKEYLKAQAQQIVKYPYTFMDLILDNPQVSFPSDYFGGTYDSDLATQYEVYPLITLPHPQISDQEYLIGDEEIKLIDGQWTKGWIVCSYTEEQLFEQRFDLHGFLQAMAIDVYFIEWQSLILATPSFTDNVLLMNMRDAFQNGNISLSQVLYNQLKEIVAIPDEANAIAQWSQYADQYGIRFTFMDV
jgi:hypothetical protein